MFESLSRTPRAVVMINGIRIAWLDIEVNNNSYYQADSFRFSVPAQQTNIDKYWWAGQDSLEVEVFFGFPADPNNYVPGDLVSMLSGKVDNIVDSLIPGLLVLTGRDYAAPLIENKTMEKWPERRASDIAVRLANRYGLTPVVKKTTRKVGTYYAHDHTKLNSQSTDWNLLCWLAKEENFQVYVKGKALHFEPRTDSDVYIMPYSDSPKQFSGAELSFERNLTLAKDIIVKVRSWNQKQKKGFTKEAKALRSRDRIGKKTNASIGVPQVFSYVIPNLTAQQAQDKANSLLKSISAHQIKLIANGVPADTVLTPQHVIKVNGTPYDQFFYPDSVIRRFNQDGFLMDIVAKNHDTNSEIIV